MTRRAWVNMVMLYTLVVAPQATATTPSMMNYQGLLTNGSGTPQVGTFNVTFSIYYEPNGGAAIWTETQIVTTDPQGRFNTLLGTDTPLTDGVFATADRYLGTTVSPDPEMAPRARISAVAYAFRTATVDGAAGGVIGGNVSISNGSIVLDPSSANTGNIIKGGVPFLHDFGTDNTFVGKSAGNLTMTSPGNTGCGALALYSNSIGRDNTATGHSALVSNSTGSFNTAIGINSLSNNTSGGGNTASGDRSLYSNISGGGNTASGTQSLYNNTIGSNNTAIGTSALYDNTTGGSNTACGDAALHRTTLGGFNTAFGNQALFNNVTGTLNTAIGRSADVAEGSLTNATAIGSYAVVDASNKIRLGNAGVTVIEGQVAYTFTSDENSKENFKAVDGNEVLGKIRGMDLSSWNYKGHDPAQFRHYGPVAQEFFEAFGHDGVGTSGSPTTINSGDQAGILMIAVQALERRNQELEATIAEMKSRLERLEEK